MTIVLKLQRLEPAAIHSEMDLVFNSLSSTACPTTGMAENDQFEME